MNRIKKITSSMVIWGTLTLIPVLTHADPVPGGGTSIPNPVKGASTIWELLAAIINNIIMPIAGVVAVIYIIWAGFKYVTAQGNEKKIQEAHQNLLWALIGVGVLLGAAGISSVLSTTIKSVLQQ